MEKSGCFQFSGSKSLFPFFFFKGCGKKKAVACEILVPRPGIEPIPLTLEVQSLNPWTPGNSHSFALAFASIKWRVGLSDAVFSFASLSFELYNAWTSGSLFSGQTPLGLILALGSGASDLLSDTPCFLTLRWKLGVKMPPVSETGGLRRCSCIHAGKLLIALSL